MDHRSPPFEATLLYGAGTRPERDNLIAEIRGMLETHGERILDIEEADEIFTLFTCSSVQLLLACSPKPLPVEHFLGAERPAAACLNDAEILSKLTEAKRSVTVLVLDRETDLRRLGPGQRLIKRDICWDATECVHDNSAADLVFIAENDTLYSGEEFDRICTYEAFQQSQSEMSLPFEVVDVTPAEIEANLDPSMVAPHLTARNAPIIPSHFTQTPMINDDVLAWLDGAKPDKADGVELPDEPTAHFWLETVLSLAVPTSLALRIDQLQNMDVPKALNASALACTAMTLGLTSLPNLSSLLV